MKRWLLLVYYFLTPFKVVLHLCTPCLKSVQEETGFQIIFSPIYQPALVGGVVFCISFCNPFLIAIFNIQVFISKISLFETNINTQRKIPIKRILWSTCKTTIFQDNKLKFQCNSDKMILRLTPDIWWRADITAINIIQRYSVLQKKWSSKWQC